MKDPNKWLFIGFLLLLLVVVWGAFCEGHRKGAESAQPVIKQAELQRLIAEGEIVEQEATIQDLRGLADSQALRIAELEAREPGVKIVEVIRAETVPARVPPAPTPRPPTVALDCRWWDDNCLCPNDEYRINTTITGFKTVGGNRILLGDSSVDIRRAGAWASFIPATEWSSDATQWLSAERPEGKPPPTGWGAVGLVGVLDGSLAFGAGLETPGVKLFGLRLSPAVYAVTSSKASGVLVAGRVSW